MTEALKVQGKGRKRQASAAARRHLMGTRDTSPVSRHMDFLPAQSLSFTRHPQLVAPGKPSPIRNWPDVFLLSQQQSADTFYTQTRLRPGLKIQLSSVLRTLILLRDYVTNKTSLILEMTHKA